MIAILNLALLLSLAVNVGLFLLYRRQRRALAFILKAIDYRPNQGCPRPAGSPATRQRSS